MWRIEVGREHLGHASFEAFGRHEMVDQAQAQCFLSSDEFTREDQAAGNSVSTSFGE